MSKIENNTLRDILRAAGLDTFQDRRSDPKARAQDSLNGRTHYVDDSTLRFFHARVISSGCTCSDTLFYIVESCSLDHQHTRRGFRGVVFDVWGTTVYRPSMEQTQKTGDAARRAMYAWLDQFDVAGHYAAELERQAARLEQQADRMRVAVGDVLRAAQAGEVAA